jgi:hypothetical protein
MFHTVSQICDTRSSSSLASSMDGNVGRYMAPMAQDQATYHNQAPRALVVLADLERRSHEEHPPRWCAICQFGRSGPIHNRNGNFGRTAAMCPIGRPCRICDMLIEEPCPKSGSSPGPFLYTCPCPNLRPPGHFSKTYQFCKSCIYCIFCARSHSIACSLHLFYKIIPRRNHPKDFFCHFFQHPVLKDLHGRVHWRVRRCSFTSF